MTDIGKRTIDKLRVLAAFIEREHGITLARAISMNPSKMEILEGREEPSRALCVKVAAYFFIPVEILLDDSKELPPLDKIEIDTDLLSIQRNDLENDIGGRSRSISSAATGG